MTVHDTEPDGDVRARLGAALAAPYEPESVRAVAERVCELQPQVPVHHAYSSVVALRAMGWKPLEETAAAVAAHTPEQHPPCRCPEGSECAERYGAWRFFSEDQP